MQAQLGECDCQWCARSRAVDSRGVDALRSAGYGEVIAERVNSRNGYRPCPVDEGRLYRLVDPKLREGSYYPGWLLEPRRRAERAALRPICGRVLSACAWS